MKKRDLLLAGSFLFSVSAFAQPGVTEPITDPAVDAKVIFTQDFEDEAEWVTIPTSAKPAPTHPDWHIPLYTWNAIPVDSIEKVDYYVQPADKGQWKADMYGEDAAMFKIAGTRDTLMYLYDGVMRTDRDYTDDSCLQWDNHYIVTHTNESQAGSVTNPKTGLSWFGEDGGNQFFRYVSATSRGVNSRGGGGGNWWSPSHDENSTTQDHYVPEYRRNLFIRNIPIDDSSSYRVTLFVKPTLNATRQQGVKPRIGVQLMRGYFHSEKDFQVNREGSSKVAFDDKKDLTAINNGEWNKIVLMAYYTNDSIGDAFPYDQTYYWQDDWTWKVPVSKLNEYIDEGKDSTTLRYIRQPDKYFVRLSFRSDSTTFDVDNITLTKSWIGGVEFYDNMIRVDMGYQTNLGTLAANALEKNKIASVQIPGENFEVWGLMEVPDYDDEDDDGDTEELLSYWNKVEMNSAEYQGNGYMYAWTKEDEFGTPQSLEYYSKLLVSFINPTDPDLQLRYTGSRYPNGTDPEWIADEKKRVVFDFHNEIAYLNQTIKKDPKTGEAIKSLAELTPRLQSEEIPDGAFGLDPATTEMKFKFSKNLTFDNLGSDSKKSLVRFIGKDENDNPVAEYWDIQDYGDIEDGTTTVKRPAGSTTPLKGDFVVQFIQITHKKNPSPEHASDDYTPTFSVCYHFGDFDVDARPSKFSTSDWRSEINDYDATGGVVPTSLYIYDSSKELMKGNGDRNGANSRLYVLDYGTETETDSDNCGYYLSSRSSNSGTTGNLYTLVNVDPGTYTVSFKATGWNDKKEITVYAYAKPEDPAAPAGELQTGSAGRQILMNTTKKEIGKFTPATQASNTDIQNKSTGKWPEGTETFTTSSFNAPMGGLYVIEWVVKETNNNGVLIGNFTLTKAGPVCDVNVAIDSAAAVIDAAAESKYHGPAYSNLVAVKGVADGFIATKKATYLNLPAEYEAEAKTINDAVTALKAHMDTINAFDKAMADAQALLNRYGSPEGDLKEFEGLAVVGELDNLVNVAYFGYDYSQAPEQIDNDTKAINDAIAAVNARQALNDKLTQAITDAETALTNLASLSVYSVYGDLEDIVATIKAEEKVLVEDAIIESYINEIKSAQRALENRENIATIATKRIKALDQLAKKLNLSYSNDPDQAADIAERIANIDFDDDALANIQKAAIKIAMYDSIIIGSKGADSLMITPFIKNYHLYASVKGIEDRAPANAVSDKIWLPGSHNDFFTEPVEDGYVQMGTHQYDDNKNIWILVLGQTYANSIYPGWTVTSFDTGENKHNMVTPDKRSYENLKDGILVFDGLLTLDWNSKAELTTEVEDLPVGIYALTVGMKNPTHDSSNSVSTLTVTTSDEKSASLTQTKKTDVGTIKVDSIAVTDGNMGINLTMTTGNGGAECDDFTLLFLGQDPTFDYVAAAEAARGDLDNLITVVDFTEIAEAAEYEYYTLNWIKVENPEKNQVYFRKSGNVVEKVIFK